VEIIILDGYAENPGDLSWSEFEALGRVTVYDRTPAEQVVQRIGKAEVVIVNKTPLTRETLAACPDIRYIGLLATGYDVVDVAAARERGIVVSNIPSYGTYAVGQFAIALLLEICCRVGHHACAVKEGRWSSNPDWCFWDYPLIELYGKTMGIIGFGRIGQTTGSMARALGMRVLAYDVAPDESARAIAEYVPLDTLFAHSDVVALHCALFPETRGIINKQTLARMKDGVVILNNSRGPLIVESDLAEALNSGKVYAAGLDVVSGEPISPDNPLLKAKNCFITPHISWAAIESRRRLLNTAVGNLQSFLRGVPANTVAGCGLPSARA
jgi:glycerate dehydrogenase